MDEDAEQQPVRVHRDVPLAPLQPFRRIPTTWAAALGGLDALGIDDGCRGAGVPSSAVAQHDHKAVANALPTPRLAERRAYSRTRCARAERPEGVADAATGSRCAQDRTDHPAAFACSWSAAVHRAWRAG